MPIPKRSIRSTIFTDTEFDYEFVFFPKTSRSKGDPPKKTDTGLQIVERKARKGYVNALRNRLQTRLEENKSVASLGEGKKCRDQGCAGRRSPRLEELSSKQAKKRVQVMENNSVVSGKTTTFPYTRPGVSLAECMRLANEAAEPKQKPPLNDEETITQPEIHSPNQPSSSVFVMDVDDPSELASTVTIPVAPPSIISNDHEQVAFDVLALVPVTPLCEEPMEVDYPPLIAETVRWPPPPPYSKGPRNVTFPDFNDTSSTSASAQAPTSSGDAPLATITNTTPKHPNSAPESSTSTPNALEKAMNAHRDARRKEQTAKRREIRGLPVRRGARTGARQTVLRTADGQCSSSKGSAAPNEGKSSVYRWDETCKHGPILVHQNLGNHSPSHRTSLRERVWERECN